MFVYYVYIIYGILRVYVCYIIYTGETYLSTRWPNEARALIIIIVQFFDCLY